jgi:oligosaccharyltransferase complex subunit gamma
MKFFGFLSLLSFCLSDQAADNAAKLIKLSKDGNDLIAFDSASFQMATKGSRNYAVFAILTALNPQFGCNACKMLQKEFMDLQYSVSKSLKKGRLFIGYLDYSVDSKDIFASMKLENVPHLMIYYPNAGVHASGKDVETIQLTRE